MRFISDKAIKDKKLLAETTARIKSDAFFISEFIDKKKDNSGEIFASIPEFDSFLNDSKNLAKEKWSKNLKYVFVIGIGGSNLGTKAIYEALHKHYDILETSRYPKLIFLDTCDPEYLRKLDFFLESRIKNPDEVILNIISKSGDTLETIANTEYTIHCLKRRFKNIEERIVSTTEKDSILWKKSKEKNISTLEIPKNLSGRFSVFSNVGFFPLILAKIKIDKLILGAKRANSKINSQSDSPMESASVAYLNLLSGKNIYDHFIFHTELESLGKWMRQLIAESLGKAKTEDGKKVEQNFTPTVTLGSVDLHSVLQLYLAGPKDKYFSFISSISNNQTSHVPKDREFPEIYPESTRKTIGQIMDSILIGVKGSFYENGLPYSEIILEDLKEEDLGELMQFKMLEVYFLAKLMKVNPFNQPEIENYKIKTKSLLVGMPGYASPAKENWSHHAIVYQIYPRSFKDSDGNGIGDLEGIIEKLDYLNDGTKESLGINAIWLNPIYKSPQKDFGYDISDYYDIDPVFGDLEIFSRLTEEAHKRGIKILMDFVPNHTSSEHPWFLESKSSRNNPKRDWYIWRDPKSDGSPPNNWVSVFGGSAWKFSKTTGQYYLHSFLESQPDLNWRNKEVKEEMQNVLKFWIHHGVDGFRTDAIYHLIKDSQFRDDPQNPNYVPGRDDPYNSLLHIFSTGQPELLETTNSFCSVLGEHGNQFLVSEAYLDIKGMEKLYAACGNKLHAPLNFNLMNLPWNATAYKKFIDDFNASVGEDQVPNYVLGNHDVSRIATKIGERKSRLMAMILLTLRGMAFIYYGEELGMEDVKIPPRNIQDAWGKEVQDAKYARDPERSPMQWNAGANAGFSQEAPWLPIHPNFLNVNVETESKNPKSILNLYKNLTYFRKNSQALKYGKYFSYDSGNSNVFAFTRESEKEKVLVVANFSENPQKINNSQIQKARIILNTALDTEPKEVVLKNFELKPFEGYVFTF